MRYEKAQSPTMPYLLGTIYKKRNQNIKYLDVLRLQNYRFEFYFMNTNFNQLAVLYFLLKLYIIVMVYYIFMLIILSLNVYD